MRYRPCAVTVTQLPETVVLDCSHVREMDRFAIHMLLCCLEEAMKRDGDVKLASVSESARKTLQLTRVDRLFEIYETEAEAVNSFFRPHTERTLYARGAQEPDELSESAA